MIAAFLTAWWMPAAFGGVTLTPSYSTVNLVPGTQPRFTIAANLPNPSTATDHNGNTQTDAIQRIVVNIDGSPYTVIYASSYNGVWSDPRGGFPGGTYTYTVNAEGYHYDAYSNWINAYDYDYSHWGEVCHTVDDGYYDDDDNFVKTGDHEECDTEWIVGDSGHVDAHWETGFNSTWTLFGTATLRFFLTTLQGTSSITPYNNATTIGSPAQPKFTLSASVTNGRTVTDYFGNTKTDEVSSFEITSSTGGTSSVAVHAPSYNALWADPRANLAPGQETYVVKTWVTRYDAYDNGWVDGHWHDEGYYEEQCHEESDGYMDDDGIWVQTSSETVCDSVWVSTEHYWVDAHRDAGIAMTVEQIAQQELTYTITQGVPQTITFPAIANHSWGEPAFTLSATASSNLPVLYTVVSGPAVVNGSFVTLTGTGTVTIAANQFGDATYGQAAPVTRSFTAVAGQSQTITFPAIANTNFGVAPFAISATASPSGLPVTFAVTGGPATISGSTVTVTGAGTITITASQVGSSTYSPAPPVSRSFTAGKGSQSISFTAISDHVDGDAPFAVTAVADSFLPVSFSIVSGPASISGNIVTLVNPGQVTVRASQAGDSRYNAAAPVDQTFNVGLGPNGHLLLVQNGTASGTGGNSGTILSLTAVPAGTYFTGWTIVSGNGSFANLADPNTTFTLGTLPTTVRANYSNTAPSYGLTWNELNVPSSLTASSNVAAEYTGVFCSGVVTNSGTKPWPYYIIIEVRRNNVLVGSGNLVCPGGLAPGQTAPIFMSIVVPNSPASATYTFQAVDYFATPGTTVLIGGMNSRTLTLVSRSSPPPVAGRKDTSGTVTMPFNDAISATNSPTSFSAIGALPPGVSLNSTTGALTGTPNSAGFYGPTIVVANASGNTSVPIYFQIYPYATYALSVTGGQAGSSTLVPGTTATITANAPVAGQIFNGWTVANGYGSFTDAQASATSVRLTAPGDLAVQANFITGNRLYVQGGKATPMGGVTGAPVNLTSGPDGEGVMFGYWTTTGPGTIGLVNEQSSTYTMGPSSALVTANFVPGYRLNAMDGVSAAAKGGLPGDQISVWGGGAGSAGYRFIGYYLEGPGYVISGADGPYGPVVMAKGATRVHAASWRDAAGPIPKTMVWPTYETQGSVPMYFSRYKNDPFSMTIATDCDTAVTFQQLDYSVDGGVTWIQAFRHSPDLVLSPDSGNYRYQSNYTKPNGFADPGMVIFRGKSEIAGLQSPVCYYMTVRILNISSATFLTQPIAVTQDVGGTATFSVIARGDGGGVVGYQWRKGVTDIAGQSGTQASEVPITLTLSHITAGDAGDYSLAIRSGIAGSWIYSNSATLTVKCVPPVILIQPAPANVAVGGTATFSVTPGPGSYTYQWMKNGSDISGATSSSYTIANVQTTDAGSYSVRVIGCATTTSSGALLTVDTSGPPQPDPTNQNKLNVHIP